MPPYFLELLLIIPFLLNAVFALKEAAWAHLLLLLLRQQIILPLSNISLPLNLGLEFSEVLLFLFDMLLSAEQLFLLSADQLLPKHQIGVILLFLFLNSLPFPLTLLADSPIFSLLLFPSVGSHPHFLSLVACLQLTL